MGFFCSWTATLTFCWRRFQIKWRKRYKSGKFFFYTSKIDIRIEKQAWMALSSEGFNLVLLKVWILSELYMFSSSQNFFSTRDFRIFYHLLYLHFHSLTMEKLWFNEKFEKFYFLTTLFLFFNKIPLLDFYSDYYMWIMFIGFMVQFIIVTISEHYISFYDFL